MSAMVIFWEAGVRWGGGKCPAFSGQCTRLELAKRAAVQLKADHLPDSVDRDSLVILANVQMPAAQHPPANQTPTLSRCSVRV